MEIRVLEISTLKLESSTDLVLYQTYSIIWLGSVGWFPTGRAGF